MRGFAEIHTTRDTLTGPATAGYNGNVWGALADVSYYIPLGRFRIVPRAGTDWLRSRTDPYSEAGGFLPATIPGLTISRTRIFAGGELGNFWMIDKTMIDVSAYGRLTDVVSFNAPPFVVATATGGANAQPVQPVTESPRLRNGCSGVGAAVAFSAPLCGLRCTAPRRLPIAGRQRWRRVQVVACSDVTTPFDPRSGRRAATSLARGVLLVAGSAS